MLLLNILPLFTLLALLSHPLLKNTAQAQQGSASPQQDQLQLQSLEISGILTDEVNLGPGTASNSQLPSPSHSPSTPSWKSAECHRRPVVHVLEHSGCIPMPVPSAACVGTCNSYVQVSSSKFWQVERSCSCCAELGQLEATFYLRCPRLVPQFKKVTARSPKDCACRPCTAVDAAAVQPQDMLDLARN